MFFAGPRQLQAINCDIVSGTLLGKVISNTEMVTDALDSHALCLGIKGRCLPSDLFISSSQSPPSEYSDLYPHF
jgi:hypothetical protein